LLSTFNGNFLFFQKAINHKTIYTQISKIRVYISCLNTQQAE